MIVKAVTIYAACRITGSSHNDAVKIGGLLQQGGEFGFVLFSAATAAFLFPASTASLLIATVTLTMAATPLGVALVPFFFAMARWRNWTRISRGAGSDVLIIGFSRFGQLRAGTAGWRA